MSAGICIMNRNAIAMAADSAVTIGNHIAIHNSANKLFSLSRVAPVGAIVYSNGAFMGVPFEIIIKEYKKYIGDKTFPTLMQYYDNFISFLENHNDLLRFTLNEEDYVIDVFDNVVSGLNGDYGLFLKQETEAKGALLTDREKIVIAKKAINSTLQFIDKLEKVNNTQFLPYIRKTYKNKFIAFLNSNSFGWLNKRQKRIIAEKACEIYDTKFERNGYVGFAIAGYGDTEIYPSLVHVHLTGYINGKIRDFLVDHSFINEKQKSSIVTLAQTDVMQTFLFGINDYFFNDLAKEIPKQVLNCINTIDNSVIDPQKKQIVFQQMTGVTEEILKHMQEIVLQNYMLPIYQSVATLPIEELGLLAESLINITSIRRRVALDSNIGTVGGPIDVSIITKGDGFIWLKRKHYFERKYNPQFFYSHYENYKGGDLSAE